MTTPTAWPPHEFEELRWVSHSYHQGRPRREDREFSSYESSIPPLIADLEFQPTLKTSLLLEQATADISALDAGGGRHLSSLSGFLIRSESVASSRIEQISVRTDDFLRALAGTPTSPSADETLAAVTALTEFVDSVAATGDIDLAVILRAHYLLMHGDLTEARYPGRIRSVPNWIGGSNYTPRGAIHVPPEPSRVPALMDDLLAFCRRDDISAIAQAAIAHAQFESIHPFTDGNGRIGRALIAAVLRRRRLARVTVPPIASVMLADVNRYFSLVNSYRDGQADAFVAYVAASASIAATEAERSAEALALLPAEWRLLAQARANSVDDRIISALLENPVLTSSRASSITGAALSGTYLALDRLTAREVLRELTGRQRDRVWVADEVVDEFDRLNERIGRRVAAH